VLRCLADALVAVVLAAVLGAAGGPAAAASNPRPLTIPALREWTGGTGGFRLVRSSRIVLAWRDRATLRSVGSVFAADLRALTGRSVRLVSEAPGLRVRVGDICLRLGAGDPRLGGEGYRISIGRRILVAANDPSGVFYATRTLLQLVRQSPVIPAGFVRDWPRYPERGLMVDIGRKYFTLRWLAHEVRELAYLKLNYLHLHFSEAQGWRIESDGHPEVVSAQHLTKAQVRELLALAARYHVTVVPEIDMPGHLRAALARHPELQLRDALGQSNPDALDYTLPSARRFAQDLIDEYLALFPGPFWHLGADEFPTALVPQPVGTAPYPQLLTYAQKRYGPLANSQDAYLGFINWVDQIVRAHGKTLRVWNDGLPGANVVKLNPDIVVEWWQNPSGPLTGPGPQDLIDEGHSVLNAGWFPTYYVSSGDSTTPPIGKPDMRWAYQSWNVNQFYGAYFLNQTVTEPPFTVAPGEPRNLGSVLHEWNDNPNVESEAQIADGIAPRLRVLAQKTWDTPPLAPSYDSFDSIMNTVGHTPG
jgi:hexosaminidase